MRIFVDTASLAEIEEWNEHPWVSGFTTNPTLMRTADITRGESAMQWAREVVRLTDKPVSIDGPPEVWGLGENVWRKVTTYENPYWSHERGEYLVGHANARQNLTAICHEGQMPPMKMAERDIISVFAGRIMDTGRDPISVINAAKQTGAQVLWASVREPYNIVMAEDAGCDIITVPPSILRKWLDWQGKPLEVVAAETIHQFEQDSVGLWGGDV